MCRFRNLDIAQMRGNINYMLNRMDVLAAESPRLGRQLRLLELLVDSVDLAETIGVGYAAKTIRDNILGTGDGGGLADELEASRFPLGKYTNLNAAHLQQGLNTPSAGGDAEGTAEEEDDRELSPRLENLNHQLRSYLATRHQQDNQATPPSCRILVFVNTRTTVSALKGYLLRHYPELKPNFVVGHGGIGGQSWGEGEIGSGQAAIIRDFHRGECQLLVCTTVLEEGIDVSACDLVIRYTGVNSLIQFIQGCLD